MVGIHSVINQNPLFVSESMTIQQVAEKMQEMQTEFTLVGDKKKVQGVFSEKDGLYRVIAAGLDPKTTAVTEVMTTDVVSIPVDFTLSDAYDTMYERKMRHLLVHNEDKDNFGVIHLFDILRVRTPNSSDLLLDIEETLKSLNFKLQVNRDFFQSELNALVSVRSSILTKIITKSLNSMGAKKITNVDSGEQVLEVIKNSSEYNCVLYDWFQPRVSGIEVLMELRKQDHRPFFLMISEPGGSGAILDAITFGADNFIFKPFNPEKLRQRLSGRYAKPIEF